MNMISDSEAARVRNLSDQGLREYIDTTGTASPERIHALHVLDDRHQLKNQAQSSELISVIKKASDSSDSLGGKLYILNWILVAATIVGASATVVMALEAWH
jgi:hypothetical protein